MIADDDDDFKEGSKSTKRGVASKVGKGKAAAAKSKRSKRQVLADSGEVVRE